MRVWGRDGERELFQKKVSAWKAAEEDGPNPRYPVGHKLAGKPMELALVTLHLENEHGRQYGYIEVRADMDPVDLVKDIFDSAQHHATTTKNFGSRVALFTFGDCKRPHFELGTPTYPEDAEGGSMTSWMPRSDLTQRGNQEAAALQVLVQGVQRVMEVAAQQTSTFMQGAGTLLTHQQNMLNASHDENRQLRSENNTLRMNAESVKNQELERELKRQNAELLMMFKRLGVEHIFAVIPAVLSVAYRKVGEKLGLDNSPMEDRIFRIADMIFKTPDKMNAVMEGMPDEEKQALITLVQEAKKQKDLKLYFERGKALTGGVTKPLALSMWQQKFPMQKTGT